MLTTSPTQIEESSEIINYKGKPFKVDFEIMNVPKLQEIKCFTQGGYYQTNRDRPIPDTWFQQLLELYYTSPLHGAILNKLHRKINIGMNDPCFKDLSFDAIVMGGWACEVMWNYYHTKIVERKPLPFEKVRCGLIDPKTRKIEYYMYSNDWFKTSYRKWYKLDIFNEDKNSNPHQLYYYKMGRQFDVYPKPYYANSIKYVYVQNELSTYFSSLIKNQFTSNGILHIPNPGSEEQQHMEEALFVKENNGSKNAGGIIVTYGRSDEAPTFVPFNSQADDQKWSFLPDYTDLQIVMGHQVPIQIILPQPGKLGGTDEYDFYNKKYEEDVVQPMKEEILAPYEYLKKLMI